VSGGGSDSGYYRHQPNPGNLVSRLSLRARRRMFETLMRVSAADTSTTVLDVGVTSDQRTESNFLEKWYPYPAQMVAVGLEQGGFLERECPGVRYLCADGLRLPFRDQSFDLVTCFAVVEHVGSRARQRSLVHELCRLGKRCFIATPNRWYPMEVHTLLPLLHWLPPRLHRALLRRFGHGFYAQEANLNLLDGARLRAMFPSNCALSEHHYRLLGAVSNLVFYALCRAA
jgi:hypothetical protein